MFKVNNGMALHIIAYEASNLSIYQNSKIWTTDITHKRVEALFVIYFKREKEEYKISRAFLRKESLGHFDVSGSKFGAGFNERFGLREIIFNNILTIFYIFTDCLLLLLAYIL